MGSSWHGVTVISIQVEDALRWAAPILSSI